VLRISRRHQCSWVAVPQHLLRSGAGPISPQPRWLPQHRRYGQSCGRKDSERVDGHPLPRCFRSCRSVRNRGYIHGPECSLQPLHVHKLLLDHRDDHGLRGWKPTKVRKDRLGYMGGISFGFHCHLHCCVSAPPLLQDTHSNALTSS
jgi:hypothetical protein